MVLHHHWISVQQRHQNLVHLFVLESSVVDNPVEMAGTVEVLMEVVSAELVPGTMAFLAAAAADDVDPVVHLVGRLLLRPTELVLWWVLRIHRLVEPHISVFAYRRPA